LENFKLLHRQGATQMFVTFSIFSTLQVQSARLKAIFAELDRKLEARYGERYRNFKQKAESKVDSGKVWYDKTKAEAEANGTIPIEERQAQASRKVADAGSAAARKEAVIKEQLKDLWQSIKTRKSS
jgi:murein L,D-transpeptidase YafK